MMHRDNKKSSQHAMTYAHQKFHNVLKAYFSIEDEYGHKSAEAVIARLKKNMNALAMRKTG